MIWYECGPWKRVLCFRDEVPHLFPNPHFDTLEGGELSAEQAREVYTETAAAYVSNRPAPLAEGFQFILFQEDTNDTDKSTLAPAMVRRAVEKIKDMMR